MARISGHDYSNVAAAQKALHHCAKCNRAAALGRYNEQMKKELAA